MATIKFYLDTRREKKDGLFPIKLNVHNKGTFFSLQDILPHGKNGMGLNSPIKRLIIKQRMLRYAK